MAHMAGPLYVVPPPPNGTRISVKETTKETDFYYEPAETVAATTATVPTSTPYDPHCETDPLIAAHITRQEGTGRIVFKTRPYAVGAVVLHLRAPHGGRAVARREFPELPEEALDAALRFAELHPESIHRYL